MFYGPHHRHHNSRQLIGLFHQRGKLFRGDDLALNKKFQPIGRLVKFL